MRSFACIFGAALALLVTGCNKSQNLGGGTGGSGAEGGQGSGAAGGGSNYDPCAGKSCGDPCTVCAPDDADCQETTVEKFCDPNGQCGSGAVSCGGTCTYNGQTYQSGETFPATDGCNTCQCDNGNVGCTEIACTECGGIQGKVCGPDQYCHFANGTCDIADNLGVCAAIPMACDTVYKPVCGCDGQTYGNDCEAAIAGVSIDHEGACEGELCGGLGGIMCKSGQYCHYADGTCDVDDITGACEAIPQACEDVLEPVCGCDGVTYGNSCEAAAAGVSLAHKGEC